MTAEAGGHSQQASREPQAQRLQKKDAQQVGRSGAHRFQNRQHVHALFEMRMHGHGHADRAQHHRHQADEAQDGGGPVETLGERRTALAIVNDLRLAERLFQLLAEGRCVDSLGKLVGKL